MDMDKVAQRKRFMTQHGLFNLLESGPGSFRVFEATCECDQRKLKGLMFYKWVKKDKRSKVATRLIIHIVCYECGQVPHVGIRQERLGGQGCETVAGLAYTGQGVLQLHPQQQVKGVL